jgi:hypothetical protein
VLRLARSMSADCGAVAARGAVCADCGGRPQAASRCRRRRTAEAQVPSMEQLRASCCAVTITARVAEPRAPDLGGGTASGTSFRSLRTVSMSQHHLIAVPYVLGTPFRVVPVPERSSRNTEHAHVPRSRLLRSRPSSKEVKKRTHYF